MADTNTMDPAVQETLEKTELGHAINQNKNIVKWGSIAIVIIVAAIAIFKSQQEKKVAAELKAIHSFQASVLKQLTDNKLDPVAALKSYRENSASFGNNPNVVSVVVAMTEKFREKGNHKEAAELLKETIDLFPRGGFLAQLMSQNLAVAYEDNKQYDMAIGVLEPLLASKQKLYEARINLDLGRLYLRKGNKDRAETFFKAVVSNFPNDELAKLAKLYLGQI